MLLRKARLNVNGKADELHKAGLEIASSLQSRYQEIEREEKESMYSHMDAYGFAKFTF
jgi:hypothetical protein